MNGPHHTPSVQTPAAHYKSKASRERTQQGQVQESGLAFDANAWVFGQWRNNTGQIEVWSTSRPESELKGICKSGSPRLRCSESDCSYSGSFRSTWELRRHISSRHPLSQQLFQCSAVGCFRRTKRLKFGRPDKLTSHMRSMHANPSLFDCPILECPQNSLDGLEMFAHVQSHIETQDVKYDSSLRAVANGISPAFPRCLITHCAKYVPLHGLIDHLQEHGSETLYCHSEALAVADLSCAHPTEGEAIAVETSWATAFMRIILISCPLCKTSQTNHAEFAIHLVELHIHTDSQHFQIWAAHVGEALTARGYTPRDQSHGITISKQLRDAIVWRPWRFVLMNSHEVNVDLRCPECKIPESINGSTVVVHHLSLLDHTKELSSHRRKILALCPEFASHPVFEDLHVPGQVSEPYVIRLQKAGNARAKKTPSARYRTGNSRLELQISDDTDAACHALSYRREVSGSSSEERSDMPSHNGHHFYDPMVGGCEDEARVGAMDYSKASAHLICLDGTSSSTIRHVDEETRVAQSPPTTRQPYSKGKRFPCDNFGCNLRFERRSDLRLHQRAHVRSEERPYKCDLCYKKFMYPKDRRRHQKIHNQPCLDTTSGLVTKV